MLFEQWYQDFGSCPHHSGSLCQILPPPFCPQPSAGHALIYDSLGGSKFQAWNYEIGG
jgi:hypothetical protein